MAAWSSRFEPEFEVTPSMNETGHVAYLTDWQQFKGGEYEYRRIQFNLVFCAMLDERQMS